MSEMGTCDKVVGLHFSNMGTWVSFCKDYFLLFLLWEIWWTWMNAAMRADFLVVASLEELRSEMHFCHISYLSTSL